MKKKRTESDRKREREEAELNAKDEFFFKLGAVKTFVEAKLLVINCPSPDMPGRHLHSNLGWFLNEFGVPGSASFEELELYLEMLERFKSDPVILKKDALIDAQAAIKVFMTKLRPAWAG